MNEKILKDLAKIGITGVKKLHYNPSYEELFKFEMDPSLEGFDKGQLTELDAVNVMTGIYTGRSPKDKFIVMDENSKNTVWWTTDEYKNDNHVCSQETWNVVKDLAHERAFHHGSCLAGSLRTQYVHQAYGRRVEGL